MKSVCLAFMGMIMLAGAASAQERIAAGALDTQMTWSALSAKIDAANAKADGVNSRVDQIVVCGRKGMIYAPGQGGADAQGCVNAALDPSITNNINTLTTKINTTNTNVSNILLCSKKNMVYAPGQATSDADGCASNSLPDVITFIPATNRYYQNTGVTVRAGQMVTMKVTGKVAWARDGGGSGVVNVSASDRPSGAGKYSKYNPVCPLRYVVANNSFHSDVYDYNGTSYCAQNSFSFKAPASGDLYLGVPEGGSNSGDNDGGFTASISVAN